MASLPTDAELNSEPRADRNTENVRVHEPVIFHPDEARAPACLNRKCFNRSLSSLAAAAVEVWGFLDEYWCMAGMYCLNDLLKLIDAEAAEELRLEPGRSPEMGVGGRIRVLDLPPITGDEVTKLFNTFASPEHRDELSRCGDVRFNFSFQNSARFKVTASLNGHQDMSLKLRRLSY